MFKVSTIVDLVSPMDGNFSGRQVTYSSQKEMTYDHDSIVSFPCNGRVNQ